MSYEAKIQKELDKYDQQWEDAVCPSVLKFGRQADKEIEKLHTQLKRAESMAHQSYYAGSYSKHKKGG